MNRNDPTYVSACMDAPEGMKTVFGDPGEDASGLLHDEVYCVRDGRELRLQIILPKYTGELMTREAVKLGAPNILPFEKLPNPLYPLIVFVQGSAWNRQDLYKVIPRMSRFVRKGYAVACVEYRESACAVWPAQLIDVKTSVRYMKANADLFGIDKNRVAIMGNSSGGHLSLMTALTMGFNEFDDGLYPEESDAVKCCVDLYGPSDLTCINKAPRSKFFSEIPLSISAEGMLLGGIDPEKDTEPALKASPVSYVDKDRELPPFLIMHGDEDGMVPFDQSRRIYEKLRDNGKRAELYKVLGAGHGLEFYSDDVMGIIFKFLENNL